MNILDETGEVPAPIHAEDLSRHAMLYVFAFEKTNGRWIYQSTITLTDRPSDLLVYLSFSDTSDQATNAGQRWWRKHAKEHPPLRIFPCFRESRGKG
jgi:hypothetical protein